MNLQSNDFELFDLPQQFAQNRSDIDSRWKQLQREAHPDKFSAQGAAAQRIAMQWSVRINEAYQRLKNPLKRAAYLCELAGFPIQAHSNTAMPSAFLMQQIQWREDLDEAKNPADIEAIIAEVAQNQQSVLQNLEQLLDAKNAEKDREHNYSAAVGQVRVLMFMEKLLHDLDTALDTRLDE